MTLPSNAVSDSSRRERSRPPIDAVDSRFLETVLHAAPDAILVLSRSGRISYANPAALAIVGCPLDRITGRPVAPLLRTSTELTRLARDLFANGSLRSEEIEVIRPQDGRGLWVSVSASLLRGQDGSVEGAVAYLRDVGPERDARVALLRKNAELEHYVHAVSHDLRSPLVSLLGFSKLLEQDYGELLDQKGRHFLDRIEQAARTMEALINDLLELSRIGESDERRSQLDPMGVLRQLQAEFKPRLDAANIELGLPAHPPVIVANRMRMYQIFSNLIGNAIEHMGERPGARIDVEIDAEERAHRIRVRDNGRGVPREHHETIFELFRSLGQRSDGRRGTGVGLAIVRKIAETQGGRVWVESEPGAGAVFHVILPAA